MENFTYTHPLPVPRRGAEHKVLIRGGYDVVINVTRREEVVLYYIDDWDGYGHKHGYGYEFWWFVGFGLRGSIVRNEDEDEDGDTVKGRLSVPRGMKNSQMGKSLIRKQLISLTVNREKRWRRI